MTSSKALESRGLYTVGWVAALPLERAAATAMLDERHQKPLDFVQPQTDKNSYTWGRIGEHNVVISSLAAGVYGIASAAATALPMLSSFPQIRIGLLVGIGAGIARPEQGYDIRLGDVVVGQPDGRSGGVIQYDLGKAKSGCQRECRSFLNMPPEVLLRALANLRSQHELKPTRLPEFIEVMAENYPKMIKSKHGYTYQGPENDRLFKSTYDHVKGTDCRGCDPEEELPRHERDSTEPEIHYGIIASGNTLIKDAAVRDKIVEEIGEDCICFEMEAAGLANSFPCLVIRGICDYADSHKNDQWQRYAAATAAAYARELLEYVPGEDLAKMRKAVDTIEDETMADIHSITTDTRTAVERLNQDSQFKGINDWLSPADPSTNLNDAIGKRHRGTGSWFLENSTFKDWNSGSRQHLWLHGFPGCGKDSQKELDRLFTSCNSGKRQPTTESLLAIFQDMVNHVKKIQIVIDALDECQTRRGLFLWMGNLCRPGNTKVYLLATSRAEEEIKSEIERWLHHDSFISIQQPAMNDDIRAYVRARLQEDHEFERWRLQPSVKDEIETELLMKAGGMFRWAACQLDSVQRCLDLRKLRKTLASLPKTLDETYARILASIHEEDREDAIRILQFLSYSKRPLTLEEAVDIIAVDPCRDPSFDPQLRMPIPREIARICSSLVSIVARSDHSNTLELQLAHFSVKEYLTSGRVQGIFQESFTEVGANHAITMVSLAYLSHLPHPSYLTTVSRRYDWDEIRDEIGRGFPLVDYCAKYWMNHAKLVETRNDIRESILKFFLQQPRAYVVWSCLFESLDNPGGFRSEGVPSLEETPPLYYASFGGLERTTNSLLQKGANVNANADGSQYGNALQAASCHGHEKIVQLLLENGADINIQGGDGNALQAATLYGHEKIVRLLLENGADIDMQGGFYGNALPAASSYSHEKVVQLLLENDANINMQGGCYDNALNAASYNGYEKIVQLLLESGADINMRGCIYGNALEAASSNGHEKIVQLLRENGADPGTARALLQGYKKRRL